MNTASLAQRLGAVLVLPLLFANVVAAQSIRLETAPVVSKPRPAYDSTRVYTYVEQMPELPGGGSQYAIAQLVQRLAVVPVEVREGKTEGRVFVTFIVGPHGSVYGAKVAKTLSSACDAAALAAVAKLPRFVPGKQNGQAVAVNLTLPITFAKASAAVAAGQNPNSVAPVRTDAKVYTYAEQMPELPGLGGTSAVIGAAIRERVASSAACNGRVFVAFTVNADGSVSDPKITKGVGSGCDAATVAAVAKLPRFKPAHQNGEAVAVRFLGICVIFDPAAGK